VAERIRTKYFPKKVVPSVGPRLVKHVKRAEETSVEAPPEVEHTEIEAEFAAPQPTERPAAPVPQEPEVARPKVRILKPAAVAPPPPQGASAAPQPSSEVAPEPAVAAPEPLGYGRPMLAVLWVLRILSILVIAEAILSWVQPMSQSPRRELSRITNPLYAPIRSLIPPGRLGGLDISPLIVLLLIQLASRAIIGIAYSH